MGDIDLMVDLRYLWGIKRDKEKADKENYIDVNVERIKRDAPMVYEKAMNS
jgi:hypothetical protein